MTYSSVKSSCVLAVVLWLLCNVTSAEFYSDSLKHHKMEKQIPRDSFVQKGKSSSSEVHKLVFAVHQKNLDVLEQKLKESSTPGTSKYLQWMTFEEVGKLSSDPEAAHEITEWLEKNGATIVSVTKHLDFITATAPIETWEKLLDTEFFEWEDQTRKRKSGAVIHRAKEYSIPLELKEHVAAVFNTVQTPPPYKAKYHFDSEQPYKRNLRMSAQDSSSTTVSYLNSLYRIQNNSGSAQLSQSVFETSDMYFSPNDLTAFQNKYDLPVQAAEVKHGFDTDDCVNNECVEGNLDIQYIMGVAQETVSIYWYADNSISDPFVVWITEMANMSNPPQSNSVSWGAVESYMSSATMNAFNTQAMKLSLQGVTIAVSSGDDGAASGYQTCLCAGVTENGETSTGYNPSFPATSPYVTAVGGTMGGSSETVCQADKGGVITSGGGFSGQFSALDWQTDAVNAYFDGLSSQPVSGYYRNGRAYPDISLLAVNYPVVIQNRIVSVYGTSASAPVFAAMVSLVNAARLKKGLGSIGFINPTLYAIGMNASSVYKFNDVTSGNNKCCAQEGSDVTCCSTGFVASSGWDPATGWGSVNYDSFSGMYEAYTPYTKKEKSGTDITLEMWIIIIVVGVLLICAIGSCFSWCFCRSRDTPPTQQRVVYHDPHPQHRLSPVHIQSANRM